MKCAPGAYVSPLSILYFYDMDPDLLETYSQDQLDNALQSAIEDPAVWNNFKILFDKRVNEENIAPTYIRSMVLYGGPVQYETGRFLENGEAEFDRYIDLKDNYEE